MRGSRGAGHYNDDPVTATPQYTIREISWDEEGERLRALRHEVFVREQGVPAALEWDGLDPGCRHVVAEAVSGEAIGTGRLLPDGHIGRMAVLRPWRRGGVGTLLLERLIAMARARGDRCVVLHAQSYVTRFYARAGFEITSAEFMEAGIPHVEMRLRLR
jgi:predicted GNAT family N-acyltransferase